VPVKAVTESVELERLPPGMQGAVIRVVPRE